MQNTIKRAIIVVIAVSIYFLLFFLLLPQKGDVIRIDCTWSEISPDFTPAMREACRKARITKSITT